MELLRKSQLRRVIGRLELVDHREKLGRADLVERVLAVSLRIGLEHETCLIVVSASRRACGRRCIHRDLINKVKNIVRCCPKSPLPAVLRDERSMDDLGHLDAIPHHHRSPTLHTLASYSANGC